MVVKKRGPGRPSVGGPRIQVRFNDEKQLKLLNKGVKQINKKNQFGSTISKNAFIVNAIMKALEKLKLS